MFVYCSVYLKLVECEICIKSANKKLKWSLTERSCRRGFIGTSSVLCVVTYQPEHAGERMRWII
jgi:hypothetical protein